MKKRASKSPTAAQVKRVEQETQRIGHVKVQMFRFVDVLPMLKSSSSVTRHLQEYFEEVRTELPMAARLGLDVAQPNSLLGKALALNARINSRKMAERFIAGTKPDEVFTSVAKLRKQSLAFVLDLLGEAVVSEAEAEAYQEAYLHLLEELAPRVNVWPEDAVLDRDHDGFLPRCQVSLKLSALYSKFKPIDPEGSAEGVKERLRPIFRLARELDAHVHIDMEHYEYKDLTLEIFKQICMEKEFRDWKDVGIVIQAYLPDAESDLQDLLKWSQKRGTPVWVRLVKGAYWDYETIISEYRGWPCPVYTKKWQSDENFEKQTHFLFSNYEWLRPAIASHNLRSLSNAIAWAAELKVPTAAWEIQMLYGMADEQQQLLSERGHRVRVYAPFGELLPGMSYLVRRLLENTSNESFLRHAYDADVSVDELLRSPHDIGKLSDAKTTSA